MIDSRTASMIMDLKRTEEMKQRRDRIDKLIESLDEGDEPKLEAGWYMADKANGVKFLGEHLEYSCEDAVSPKVFKDSLKDLKDGEEIYCYFTSEKLIELKEIDREYGIN